jgi:hypothetical protein
MLAQHSCRAVLRRSNRTLQQVFQRLQIAIDRRLIPCELFVGSPRLAYRAIDTLMWWASRMEACYVVVGMRNGAGWAPLISVNPYSRASAPTSRT